MEIRGEDLQFYELCCRALVVRQAAPVDGMALRRCRGRSAGWLCSLCRRIEGTDGRSWLTRLLPAHCGYFWRSLSAGRTPRADDESPLPRAARYCNSRASTTGPRSTAAAIARWSAAPAPFRGRTAPVAG